MVVQEVLRATGCQCSRRSLDVIDNFPSRACRGSLEVTMHLMKGLAGFSKGAADSCRSRVQRLLGGDSERCLGLGFERAVAEEGVALFIGWNQQRAYMG